MNASALKFDKSSFLSLGREFGDHWKVVGQFATVEAAEEAAARFLGEGFQSRVSMVDGVTLLCRA